MSSKNIYLDVDSTILEKNLLFATDPSTEDFNRIFQPAEHPSKLVKPFPGFCIKCREVGSDSKFFVNICQTDSIPPPKDISERQLNEILSSEETSDYRVPMSIGDIRSENDKNNDEARIADVAIHPSFFEKIKQSELFKSFFITIVFEGLREKHGIICQDEKIILKHRKSFGTLQMHRIQQREIDQKMDIKKGSIIEEISGNTSRMKPLIETLSSNDIQMRTPEYHLYRKKSQPNCLIGEFIFPDIISAKELTLDIGEDRIVIEAGSKHYLIDMFVPFVIRQASCSSTFNKANKTLTVTMPLVGG